MGNIPLPLECSRGLECSSSFCCQKELWTQCPREMGINYLEIWPSLHSPTQMTLGGCQWAGAGERQPLAHHTSRLWGKIISSGADPHSPFLWSDIRLGLSWLFQGRGLSPGPESGALLKWGEGGPESFYIFQGTSGNRGLQGEKGEKVRREGIP